MVGMLKRRRMSGTEGEVVEMLKWRMSGREGMVVDMLERRRMSGTEGKLVDMLERRKMDIYCLQETQTMEAQDNCKIIINQCTQ